MRFRLFKLPLHYGSQIHVSRPVTKSSKFAENYRAIGAKLISLEGPDLVIHAWGPDRYASNSETSALQTALRKAKKLDLKAILISATPLYTGRLLVPYLGCAGDGRHGTAPVCAHHSAYGETASSVARHTAKVGQVSINTDLLLLLVRVVHSPGRG